MDKKLWKTYFNFTKKERAGVITLLALIVIIGFVPVLFKSSSQISVQQISEWVPPAQIPNNNPEENEHTDRPAAPVKHRETVLFYFDPNTATAEQLGQLSLPAKTISAIINYRNKGGKFNNTADFAKIYTLSKEDLFRLEPYVKIEKPVPKTFTSEKKAQLQQQIDINHADSVTLLKLRGIGPVLSGRIIRFRKRLGGFHSPEQLQEVYGIQDSIYTKIKPFVTTTGAVTQLNINTCNINELKAHPYVKYQIANAVIQYRNQHGTFDQIDQLRSIHLIDEEWLKKMKPYLTL